MSRELNLDLLKTFTTVAQCKHFTTAANLLHSTQSTVSMQIKRLENQLGQSLFCRSGNAAKLTESGVVLQQYAEKLLSLNQEAKNFFLEKNCDLKVNVGLSISFSGEKLGRIAKALSGLDANIEVTIHHGMRTQLRSLVSQGKLDFALSIKEDGFCETLPTWRTPMQWVFDQSMPLKQPIPLALLPEASAFREMTLFHLNSHGIAWRQAFVSASLACVQHAAQQGLGVTALPKTAVLPGMTCASEFDCLPQLPEVEFAFFTKSLPLSRHAKDYLDKLVCFLEQHQESIFNT